MSMYSKSVTLRDQTTAFTRELSPSRPFSKPDSLMEIPRTYTLSYHIEHIQKAFLRNQPQILSIEFYLATPFCRITLPLCKWPCDGKPRSRRNNNASKICRPKRCTCDRGKHVDLRVYFRFQASFHCDYAMIISILVSIIHTYSHSQVTILLLLHQHPTRHSQTHSPYKLNPSNCHVNWMASPSMHNAVDSYIKNLNLTLDKCMDAATIPTVPWECPLGIRLHSMFHLRQHN